MGFHAQNGRVDAQVTYAVEDAASDDAQWCLAQYYAVLAERFEEGFDYDIAVQTPPGDLNAPAGSILIARLDGESVGCGCVKFDRGVGYAEIKRVWVSESVRGGGVAKRLMAELEVMARNEGANVVRLDTNKALTEAIAMYHRLGYHEIERFSDEIYAHHWFEKAL